MQSDGGPPSPEASRRLRLPSAGGLVAFALTVSFAAIDAIDWLMSLSPAWYSTVYGVDCHWLVVPGA